MFDMIGGVLGAGASIAGSIMNAEAMDRANDTNWRINLLNYYQRQYEREQAIAAANKLQKEQKLGFTDIRGTRTHFVPGKGWVVEGAPEVLAMQKLQDQEQRNVLTQDLPMRRKVLNRNYVRGLQDEGTADSLRRMFQNIRRGSDDAIAADLYNAQAMGLREASRDAGRRVFTQAMRTGNNSNFAKIAGRLQEADNAAYTKAALQSRLAARGMAEKEFNEKRNAAANLYNMFATRAGQLPEVNYKPQALDAQGNADLASKNALTAGMDLTKMFAMKGGELDYISPNLALGNGIAGAGNQLASALRAGGARQQYERGGGVGGFAGTGGSANNFDDYLTTQHDVY